MAGESGVGAGLPESVTQTLFKESETHPKEFQTKVEGYHFSKSEHTGSKVDYHDLLQSFKRSGFQATNFGLAIDQVNEMVSGSIIFGTYLLVLYAVEEKGRANSRGVQETTLTWCRRSDPYQLHNLPGLYLKPHFLWCEGDYSIPSQEQYGK